MPYIGRELDSGNYLKLDDISSSFNGSLKTFNLTAAGKAFYPGSAFSILVNLAGVTQEPEAAYQINNATITFATAPVAGDQFFCIVLGLAHGINVPANGTVDGAQLKKPFNFDGFFYLDDANNRVGVGTVTPQKPLHVVGEGQFDSVRVLGDLTVDGTTTTLDTVVTEVDRLEVGANNNTVGLAVTQSGSGDAAYFMGGNVGIGTDNPFGKLQVHAGDDANFSFSTGGGEASLEILNDAGSANVPLNIRASEYKIKIQGNEKVRITSAGKIGIGQVDPQGDLHIGNISGNKDLIMHSANNGTARLRFREGGSNSSGFNEYSIGMVGAANAMTINGQGAGEIIRIMGDTGSVGIGTNLPQSQFEVFGSSPIVRSKHSTSQKYTQISNNGTDGYVDWSSGGLIFRGASNAERLRITSAGVMQLGNPNLRTNITVPFSSQPQTTTPRFQVENVVQSYSNAGISAINNSADGYSPSVTVGVSWSNLLNSNSRGGAGLNWQLGSFNFVGNDGTNFITGAAMRAYLEGTPGTNDMPTRLEFLTTPDGSATPVERMRITSVGHIGIDCTPNDHNSFTRALDVNGPSGAAVYMRTNDSTSNCFIVGNYGSEAYINNVANGNIRFFTQGAEKFRISNTGLVGINTTSPSVSLDLSNNTDAVALPTGTTAQRPSGTDAYIRKNSTNNALEFYNGTEWVEIITDYFPTGSTILG